MQFGIRIPELKSGPKSVQHVNILHRQITNTPHWLLELFHSLSQLARIQISQINDLKFLEFGTQTMCSFEKKKTWVCEILQSYFNQGNLPYDTGESWRHTKEIL